MRRGLLLLPLLLFPVCGCRKETVTIDEFHSREVKLPDGGKLRAEVMYNPADMMRGMMFRDSLAADRGMLFIHTTPGKYSYWMYQVKIPLDIIWMDRNRRIVEISANTPPCRSVSSKECPHYGGSKDALFVLELAGGVAARHGLNVGDMLQF